MVCVEHELKWIIDLQKVIEDLWSGALVPLTDDSWPSKNVTGYIEHGKEVVFSEKQ